MENNNKKKILIVLYYYYPYVSGISVYAKRLADGLASEGYSITILTTQFDKSLSKCEITDTGVKIVRCPIIFKMNKGVISPSFLLKSITLSRNNDFVNFHLPLAESGIASLFIPQKKIITTYQCDINLGNTFMGKLLEKISFSLMKITLYRSLHIITLSNLYFSNSKMKEFFKKTTEVTPPIDTKYFNRIENSSVFRNNFSISKDCFIIGFVGRIVYEKGISYLLESIPYLLKEINNIKIVIVGDYKNIAGGSIKKQLDKYLQKYPNIIIFTGFLPSLDLVKFYSMINVLVLPSIDPLEAFGMVQIEAMCCGTPVVASNMPGVNTAVNKTGFGFIAKVKDPKDIADKLILIYQKKYSQDKFNRQDWDTKKTISKYINIFNQS